MSDHAKELRLLAQQRWAIQYEHDFFFLACAGELERLSERLAACEMKIAEADRLLRPVQDCDPDIREWLGLPRYDNARKRP